MKLLSIEMSRITFIFHVNGHERQPYLPEIALEMTKRYGFAKSPRSYEELISDRVEFKHGKFENGAIDSLDIYSDGIIISSKSNTDFIDDFFSDLSGWLIKDYNLEMMKTHSVDKMYESAVIVEASKGILKQLDAYSAIGKIIERDLKKNSGLDVTYEPSGWSMAVDNTQNKHMSPSVFIFERQAGIEYSMQHYISTAPLRTKQHMELLKKFAKLV